ncbi:hypothetical protein NMG60_11037027 [Bertholletia excelsa]
MNWTWRKEDLDLVLVPSGLLIMFGYHLFLLYRYLKFPQTTVIGYENHYLAWVERIMKVESKDREQAISVISSNITAAISLSSICLVLGSLIGTWIGSSTKNIFTSNLIYGDTMAFASFVQTARCFVHANFLISMPNSDLPISYVEKAVITGSNYWSVGIRALYFATTLLLWIFGPIPICFLLQYDSVTSLSTPTIDLFKKTGGDMTPENTTTEHHGRPRGRRTSGSQQQPMSV